MDKNIEEKLVKKPNPFLYWFVCFFFELYIKIHFNLHHKGVKPKGPALILSNHTSNHDYKFIAAAHWPRRITFVATYHWFTFKKLNFWLRQMGVIPKYQFAPDMASMRKIRYALEKNNALVFIAPEGTVYSSGRLGYISPSIAKTIKVFKTVVQTILMNIPIIGKIIIYNEITMFTKTFASLLNHNVYITDCMEVLSKITNNEVYKMLIFDTITNLARGEAISNSFKNHWAFPVIAYEMILTGEKTGQLGPMMDKVANYYQEQHKNAVNQIKAFIEPVMIIILAVIVGVVLLSVVLPMFDMYQQISQT